MEPSGLLALSTGVLVIVTAYYAWQTRRQAIQLTKQTEMLIKQRRQSIKPEVVIDSITLGYPSRIDGTRSVQYPKLELKIVNLSPSYAPFLKLEGTVAIEITNRNTGEVEKRSFTFTPRDITANQYIKGGAELKTINMFPSPSTPLESSESTGILDMTTEYKDLDGNFYREHRVSRLPVGQDKWQIFPNAVTPLDNEFTDSLFV